MTGLIYNKPEDPIDFLDGCIKTMRQNPDLSLRWDSFVDTENGPVGLKGESNGTKFSKKLGAIQILSNQLFGSFLSKNRIFFWLRPCHISILFELWQTMISPTRHRDPNKQPDNYLPAHLSKMSLTFPQQLPHIVAFM